MFFCQSRALSETVAERMRGSGAEVFLHRSSVSRDEHREAEARFHHGTDAAIICTLVLKPCVDVGDLDLVFQANAPSTGSSFMQRTGRTGRRSGQVSNTSFPCESPEDILQAALPPEAETEFVANSFLDFEGAARLLGSSHV
jgi:ATP-dependent Lhr-like helicase